MDTRRIPGVRAGDPFAAAGGEPREATTPAKTTREERGLALYRERAEEIKHVRGSVWSVPSSSRRGVYLVDLSDGICTCGDMPPSAVICKHTTAATVARAKSAACAGCGLRVRRRDLYEVGDDNLTFFEGDDLCEGCAHDHGLL